MPKYSRNFQMWYPGGVADGGGLSGQVMNSAFVFETSGAYIGVNFTCPVDQTSGSLTVHAYITSITGSPDFNIQVRNADYAAGDVHRPESGGSTIGTPGSVVSPTTANRWMTFTMTGLTLEAGKMYFFLIENVSTDATTDYGTIAYRGNLDGTSSGGMGSTSSYKNVYGTNGFSADPNERTNCLAPIILKFDDDTLMGNPYVEGGAGASGTNWRGNRFNFEHDTQCSGFYIQGSTGSLENGTWGIYEGATQRMGGTIDRHHVGANAFREEPITLNANTDYDFVVQPNSSTGTGTYHDMGQGTIPTDVQNAGFQGVTYVTGATIGSLTETIEQIQFCVAILDDFPAAAGGGGGLLTHPGMAGGMRG